MVGLRRHHRDAIVETSIGDEIVNLGGMIIALDPARAPDDQHAGPGITQPRQRLYGDIDTLQRLDAADEEQHGLIAEAEGLTSTAAGTRREEGVVDARRHDLDAARISAVMTHEFVQLDHGVRRDDVAARNDVGLGIDAVLRLDVTRLGLHAGEGVERRHHRQIELVLEPMTSHPAQPVVGVQHVGRIDREMGAHPVSELVDDAGQLLLREVGVAGVDVHDLEARLDRQTFRQIISPPTDIDRDVGSAMGERGHELAHIDVHATGVTAARLDER